MSNSILTKATAVQLSRAVVPAGITWFDVPDSKLSAEQQTVLAQAKEAFGADNVDSTFCIGAVNGERIIVEPKLVRLGNELAVRFGKNSYPVNTPVSFSLTSDGISATVNGYSLRVALVDLSKLAAPTKTQTKLQTCITPQQKVDFLNKVKPSELVELLRQPGNGFTKLSAMTPGSYDVVGYEKKTTEYGQKYTLELADGTKVSGNTAVSNICASWIMGDIEVSKEKPGNLVVGASRQSKTGNTIVSIELYSPTELELPLFDFSAPSEPAPAPEAVFGSAPDVAFGTYPDEEEYIYEDDLEVLQF
jgi:hypothetical protein